MSDKPCARGHLAPRLVCNAICTECQKSHNAEFYRSKLKEYRATTGRQKVLENNRRYEEKNPGRHARYAKTDAGREVIRRISARRLATVAGRLHNRVRASVLKSLKGGKSNKTFSLLGYTVQELAACLERQFLPGMSWHNMGQWHIDHIVPLASFRITSETCPEFKAAWSLSNLRPLWSRDNLKKRAQRLFLL